MQVDKNWRSRQDAMNSADAAHNTNLHHFLSLLTDDKALDILQSSLVNNGMEGVASDCDA